MDRIRRIHDFKPYSSLSKYCSYTCKDKADLEKRSNKPLFKSCDECGNEFKPYTALDKFCSANCRVEKMKSKRSRRWNKEATENRKGKNNPAYVHGQACRGVKTDTTGSKLYQRMRKEYIEELLEKKGYLYCEKCEQTNKRFETHHIVFRSEKPNHEHLHSKKNFIHVCVKCHNHYHNKKGNRNQLVIDRKLSELFGNDILNK